MLCIVQDVEEDLQLSMSEGLKLHNRSKNRYSKVLPCQSPLIQLTNSLSLTLCVCVCGILSDDHSRVKLQATGEDGSDYTNASWVEVRPQLFPVKVTNPSIYTLFCRVRVERRYILLLRVSSVIHSPLTPSVRHSKHHTPTHTHACTHTHTHTHTHTGPMQSTVRDMWRMVWEHRLTVILMTTTLTEEGKEVNHLKQLVLVAIHLSV